MSYAQKAANVYSHVQQLCGQRWIRFVAYVKRKAKERSAKKQQEDPSMRAVRITTAATVWIAVFTAVLAAVGYLQWKELNESGAQTDRMIRLYRQQVGQLTRQANDTHALSFAAEDRGERNTIQANKRQYYWGWIAYRDVFPGTKPHLTEFCWILSLVRTRFDERNSTQDIKYANSRSFTYIECPHHNCADNYCKDYASLAAMTPR